MKKEFSDIILYRLTEDCRWLNLLEGSCITEGKFKQVYYTDKALFEPVMAIERQDLIEYKNEEYLAEKGIECMLFYNQQELIKFMEKV